MIISCFIIKAKFQAFTTLNIIYLYFSRCKKQSSIKCRESFRSSIVEDEDIVWLHKVQKTLLTKNIQISKYSVTLHKRLHLKFRSHCQKMEQNPLFRIEENKRQSQIMRQQQKIYKECFEQKCRFQDFQTFNKIKKQYLMKTYSIASKEQVGSKLTCLFYQFNSNIYSFIFLIVFKSVGVCCSSFLFSLNCQNKLFIQCNQFQRNKYIHKFDYKFFLYFLLKRDINQFIIHIIIHMTPEQLQPNYLQPSNGTHNLSATKQFICTCTKSYGSYAALYTHIRNKHNGEAPGQIKRPHSSAKRGRPTKITPSLEFLQNKANQNIQIQSIKSNQKKIPEIQIDAVEPQKNQIQISQSKNTIPQKKNPKDKTKIKYFQKYYENYYRQAMRPYYEMVQIKKLNQNSKKNGFKTDYKKKSLFDEKKFNIATLNHLDENLQKDQEDHLQDYKLVQEQLELRMKPIISGCKKFLEWYDKKTKGKITEQVYMQKYTLEKIFLQLQQFQSYQNNVFMQSSRKQLIDCPKDQDFMQVQLGVAFNHFYHFLMDISTTITQKKSIHIIMTQLINFLRGAVIRQGTHRSWTTLKLSDLSIYLASCFGQAYEQSEKFNQNLILTPDFCMKLMACLHQWSAVKQYMFNKFNRYYIEQQLAEMNKIQQKYVKNYQAYIKCVKNQQKVKAKKLLQIYKKNALIQLRKKQKQRMEAAQNNSEQNNQDSQQLDQFQLQKGRQNQQKNIHQNQNDQFSAQKDDFGDSRSQKHKNQDQESDQVQLFKKQRPEQNQSEQDYSFEILNKNLQQNMDQNQHNNEIQEPNNSRQPEEQALSLGQSSQIKKNE